MGLVGIFWDYESCPPPPALTGYAAMDNIRKAVQHHGAIKAFRVYLDIFSQTAKAVPQHQLQTSGATLTYVARSAREAIDKVMLVDMLLFAVEASEPTTIILIANSIECAYGLSQLRFRGHKVILVSDTWSKAFDRRNFIEERLRWREDVHSTENFLGRSTDLLSDLAVILPINCTIVEDSVDSQPSVSPEPPGSASSASYELQSSRSQTGSYTMPGIFPEDELLLNGSDMSSEQSEIEADAVLTPMSQHQDTVSIEIISAEECSSAPNSCMNENPTNNPIPPSSISASPAIFKPLIEILSEERKQGWMSTAHTKLDRILTEIHPDIYRLLGVSGIREYLEIAQTQYKIIFFVGGDWTTKDIYVFLREAIARQYLQGHGVQRDRGNQGVYRFDFESDNASLNNVQDGMRMRISSQPSSLTARPSVPVTGGINNTSNEMPEKKLSGKTLSTESEFYPLVVALQKLQRCGIWSVRQGSLKKLLLKEDPYALHRFSGKKKMNQYILKAQEKGVVIRDIQKPDMTRKTRVKDIRLATIYSISDSPHPQVLEEPMTRTCSDSFRVADLFRGVDPTAFEGCPSSTAGSKDIEETDTVETYESLPIPSPDIPPSLIFGDSPVTALESFSGPALGISLESTTTLENPSLTALESSSVATLVDSPSFKEPSLPSCSPSEPTFPAGHQSESLKPESLKPVPPKFTVLVTVLRELRRDNVYEIKRCKLSPKLLEKDKNVYSYIKYPGSSKISEHAYEAFVAGIITLNGSKKDMISLHADYWNVDDDLL